MKTEEDIRAEFLKMIKDSVYKTGDLPKIMVPTQASDAIEITRDMDLDDYIGKFPKQVVSIPSKSIFEQEYLQHPIRVFDEEAARRSAELEEFKRAHREAEQQALQDLKLKAMKEAHEQEALHQAAIKAIERDQQMKKEREEAERAENPNWGAW